MPKSFSPSRRAIIAGLLASVVLPAVSAHAVSIMDPFNLPAAMDGGTAKVVTDAAYGDGPRHKLDVYAPA